ncbi:polysaccharide pyruvyl transferase family protein [Microbacterium laevaniformans]|uniref:polysaccharide pyruvyl transferase family protein n=1 Tax=Microbacterium laevaniformans TaxID=36807 RepID=UPI003D98354E
MEKYAILHAYSADNLGDGLLVDAAVSIVRDAFGTESDITLASSYPSSFEYLGVKLVCTQPGLTGYDPAYTRFLRSLDEYSLIVGVGGGYLRAGHLTELLKAGLVHGPQLYFAGKSTAPSIYLPQSVGPLRLRTRRLVERLMSRLSLVYLRDDRSVAEVAEAAPRRWPDMALLQSGATPFPPRDVEAVPVVSVRHVRGRLPQPVVALTRILDEFDGYVQSTVGSNNDLRAVEECLPSRILPREELLNPQREKSRVVVAMRLHAALMSLEAGHFVIHLAYERKGFGAFADLGLDEYVHNVNSFDPEMIAQQVHTLLTSEEERRRYAARVSAARAGFAETREHLVEEMRRARVRGQSQHGAP